MNHSILLILGILILLLGRKLFWLSVAVIGFVLGLEMAPQLFHHQPEIYVLAFGIVLGIIGALLAVLLQEIAIGIAGFFFGGHLGLALGQTLAFYRPEYFWVCFLVGGLVGAILMMSFFGWALIILSSLLGAHLIVDNIHLASSMKLVAFVILVAIGIVVQASITGRKRMVATE